MIQTTPTIIELDMGELEDVLRRAEPKLDEKDYALLKALADSYSYLTEVVGNKNTSIARLRKHRHITQRCARITNNKQHGTRQRTLGDQMRRSLEPPRRTKFAKRIPHSHMRPRSSTG